MAYCYNNFFFRNQILDIKLLNLGGNCRSPFVAVFLFYFVDVFTDDIQQDLLAGKYRLVIFYLLGEVRVFFGKFFHLQTGQSLQLHC